MGHVDSITQYKETAYEDASYRIIGNAPSELKFFPMPLEAIETKSRVSDPMFHDYGGITREITNLRWHLPEDVQYISAEKKTENEEAKKFEEELRNQELQAMFNKGVNEGKNTSLHEYNVQLEQHNLQVSARMKELISDMHKQLHERLGIIERKSVQLALDIAEKLVPQAVEINPEYIQNILKEALHLAGGAVIKKIRVSVEDKEFIDVIGLDKSLAELDPSTEFEADETIKAGCIVETSAGDVDYDISKAFDRVKENVMRVLK